MYKFEVCANSVESCVEAQRGGTDRVELCAGIPEGGTTPSYGDIVMARKLLITTKLHVIIRPRGGDFLYSDLEREIMLEDVRMARRLGVDKAKEKVNELTDKAIDAVKDIEGSGLVIEIADSLRNRDN